MKNTITVEWPALPIGEPGWRTRLESLAEQAEALIGRDCTLSKTAGLALELVGLMWPVLGSAETVAATCRASLLVGAPGIVAASSAANQLAEVHERLDAIWEAAQNDPAAGRVELHPPTLNEIKPVPYELAAAAEAAEPPAVIEVIEALVPEELEPIEDEPEPDPDELPAAWRTEPAEPDLTGAVWVSATELGIALGITQSRVDRYRRAGAFDGIWRLPAGRKRGALYALEQCRVAVGPLNCPAPAPLPVVVEDWPPAVEPTPLATVSVNPSKCCTCATFAAAPTGPAAADAAALLELAGGDAGTLAALRELLGCAPV